MRVTRKGQVTIPKRVRDFLGIKQGTSVDFELAADGRVVLTTAGTPRCRKSRFARVRGSATAQMHKNWLEATRYVNMEHLKEHKKEALRALAA